MKRILAVFLAIVMMFSLVACGGKNEANVEKQCANCGASVPTENAFCGSCGEAVSNTSNEISSDTTSKDNTPNNYAETKPAIFGPEDTIEITEGNFSYKLTYKDSMVDVELTKYSGSSSALDIPKTVKGYVVTTIGEEAFEDCDSLTSVIIPDSVTTIGTGAFESCSSLKSITIPNSVTTIEKTVFQGCNSLKSVAIPNSITAIGYRTFFGCTSLESVTIPNSVTTIGQEVFYNCNSLTSVTIPDSVTFISPRAFAFCSKLKTVYFASEAQKEKFKGYFEYVENFIVQ